MPLSPKTRLAQYEIHARVGAGGMGEVYLAEDTRLHRQVALKVLPAGVVNHRESLQRFEQEAKAASALNHPNILTIYEVGHWNDTHFIAGEFVAGATLRQRLHGRPLELHEALEVAVQLASALATAHAAGIVHRDIKPENITALNA